MKVILDESSRSWSSPKVDSKQAQLKSGDIAQLRVAMTSYVYLMGKQERKDDLWHCGL
jgi:hypothetical protein